MEGKRDGERKERDYCSRGESNGEESKEGVDSGCNEGKRVETEATLVKETGPLSEGREAELKIQKTGSDEEEKG